MKFWKDKWCGDITLHTSYLVVYATAKFKEDWAASIWLLTDNGGCWAPHFIRALSDWSLDLVEHFLVSRTR